MTDHAPPFNENENRQLLISWAIAPPTGKNLWERIQAHYNKQSTVNIARTPRQLRSRFDLLSVRLTRWYMALEEAKKMKETTDPSVELEVLAQRVYRRVKVKGVITKGPSFKSHALYDLIRQYDLWNLRLENLSKAPRSRAPVKRLRRPGSIPLKTNPRRSKQRLITKDDQSEAERSDSSSDAEGGNSSGDDKNIDENISCPDAEENVEPSSYADKLITTRLLEAKAKTITASHEALITEIEVMKEDGGPGSKERREEYYAIMQQRIINKRKYQITNTPDNVYV